jgi:hypothetical protein
MTRRLGVVMAGAAAAVGLAAVVGLVGESGGSRSVGPAPVLGFGPPRADVRGCRERIEGPRTLTPERGGTTIGPISFGAPAVYRDLASRPQDWEPFPEYGMPAIKVIAVLRAGSRVTLVVPREQRPWMKLIYARPGRGGTHAVALRACRQLRSRRAQRRECGWRGHPAGLPYAACRSRYTNFSGGFGLDFAEAPKRGLCAELIVWVKGKQRPLRERLFRPRPAECP